MKGCRLTKAQKPLKKRGHQAGVQAGQIKVYMKVGPPPFCLPLVVTDNYRELAAWDGVDPQTVLSAISKFKTGKLKTEKYCSVIIEDEP